MTGKENYTRAIECKGPAYLPILIGVALPYMYEQDKRKAARIEELLAKIPDDHLNLYPEFGFVSAPEKKGEVTHWADHWGTGWSDDGHGAKTDIYPLERGYDALQDYAFPDPYVADFSAADAKLADRKDRYVFGSVWFTLFERLWMLRGFDNMLIDPLVEPENFAALRDRVLEFDLAMVDQWLTRGVDGIFFSDDWGSQQCLLVDPDEWRRHYKPSYERLFRRVREGGAHVWMHLCGNIVAILPDLIDLGLNVLNPIQPRAMDIHHLAREFGGHVCFFGGADVQGTLVYGTPEDVKREAHELVKTLGAFNGGYIASTSHGMMPETPLDNVIAMLEAFTEYLP
ncbi:MAG TPA: uroporphyrinogen decarboxylase family protein [Candidatus Hydrogenedentes bacterium]|nr:uroporphyrinogen decarboxylase family protein [Candidatus Hydrogenedentota bacterium]HOS03060.1 uroporphyrinogen decarboxylase family protein [Candidatus Hydrogenedentota bacterium]